MLPHERYKTWKNILILTSHNAIQEWVERNNGKPAHIARTASYGEVGILRIVFENSPWRNQGVEIITWEAWFKKFEEKNLELMVGFEESHPATKVRGR